jgi:hypothetical protein
MQMKTPSWLTGLLLLLNPLFAAAQSPFSERPATGDVDGSVGFEEHVETDRDSFTPAVKVVGPWRVVVESAYTFEDRRDQPESHSFPESLIRFGICRRVELRLGWNYEIAGGSEVSGGDAGEDPSREGSKLTRDHRLSYGVKIATTEQDGLIPDSVVILQGFTPTGGSSTATEFIGTYAFGWELPIHCRVDASFRYQLGDEEGDHFNGWAPSVVLKVPVLQRWTLHAEYFGEFSTNREVNFTRHYFSPGFAFLVTKNLEIGSRVGWGLNDQSVRFFCNSGFGWRF